jgi:hypothetical protein
MERLDIQSAPQENENSTFGSPFLIGHAQPRRPTAEGVRLGAHLSVYRQLA